MRVLVAGLAVALAGAGACPRARAEEGPPRVVVEARAGTLGDVTVGDARRLAEEALGLTVGASLRRGDSPWRARLTLELEPITDIGPGLSLALGAARVGVERSWRKHPFAAVEVGGVARRLSVSDEITSWTKGPTGAIEGGLRFVLGARWAVTASARYELAWYTQDLFLWQQIGLVVSVERAIRR